MAESRPASCACGAVRFHLTSAPMFIHCCHCTDCQRQTGSAFVVNALIEADRVVVDAGETEAVPLPTDSGKPHVVSRCPICRTALWSTYGGREQVRFVRVGTLDDARAFTPDVHIFTRSRVPWVTLPGAGALGSTTGRTPGVFEVYYDAKVEWPPESLARRKAAMSAGA
ncbi:MAG TPA: GFA family protein [Rhizomicrobium sp.]|nr:GFA family protein [Rhizomicrobium sp.]